MGIMAFTTCTIFVKWICSVIISLGLFVAIMAFHLLSFVMCLLLSCGIVFGLSLTYSYFLGSNLPIYADNFIVLSILSYLSKYHLILYYKVIYPGDNYDRSCWSFLKKVTKLIYTLAAFSAFVQICRLHLQNTETGVKPSVQRAKADLMGVASILILWDENKNFLICMAILVHLFSVCLRRSYTFICKRSLKSYFAIGYSLLIQIVLNTLYFVIFYFFHSWIPLSFMGAHATLYSILIGGSFLIWVIQVTLCEVFTDRVCSLERYARPHFWSQNMTSGRILFLKWIFLPASIGLFYCDCNSERLNQTLKAFRILGPAGTSNGVLIFLAFFSTMIVHALKSLMLLKNSLAKLMYRGWICYFCLYDIITLGCCDDDLDDLSDVSSGSVAVSDLTAEDAKQSRSRHQDSERRENNRGPPPNEGKGQHFGDGKRRNGRQDDPESVDDVRKDFAKVKNGIGDHNNNLAVPEIHQVPHAGMGGEQVMPSKMEFQNVLRTDKEIQNILLMDPELQSILHSGNEVNSVVHLSPVVSADRDIQSSLQREVEVHNVLHTDFKDIQGILQCEMEVHKILNTNDKVIQNISQTGKEFQNVPHTDKEVKNV